MAVKLKGSLRHRHRWCAGLPVAQIASISRKNVPVPFFRACAGACQNEPFGESFRLVFNHGNHRHRGNGSAASLRRQISCTRTAYSSVVAPPQPSDASAVRRHAPFRGVTHPIVADVLRLSPRNNNLLPPELLTSRMHLYLFLGRVTHLFRLSLPEKRCANIFEDEVHAGDKHEDDGGCKQDAEPE